MRKHFVLGLAFILATIAVARAVDDPGQTYGDAFILLQEAQNAEANSDWATATAKYSAAGELLRGIRSSNPDWNPQVVEYRLKDVAQKLDAAKAKVPAGTSVPAVEKPAEPAAPPAVATPPPAPLAAEFATPEATSRSRTEMERPKQENEKLASQHEQTRKAPAPDHPNKP